MDLPNQRIYADCAAGVAVHPAVLEEMLPYFGEAYGNPSAAYTEGVSARRALDRARERVAAQLGACPDEIYFTSGATESNNWAIRCAAAEQGGVLTSALEHPAVTEPCRRLAAAGKTVAYVEVLPTGELSLPSLAACLSSTIPSCSLVTLMYANHETGVLQPVREAVALAHDHGAALLCDAVQAAPTQQIDALALGVDFLSISGHMLGAPRGIGALYVRRGTALPPLISGGGQQNGKRSGTESVALAVALAKALELCAEQRAQNDVVKKKSERLLARLLDLPGVCANGWTDAAKQLPGTVNVSVDCVGGSALVSFLDRKGICISAGSACSSAGKRPSAVLLAMGKEEKQAMSAIRISISAQNTDEQLTYIADEVCAGVEILRSLDLVGSSKYPGNGMK